MYVFVYVEYVLYIKFQGLFCTGGKAKTLVFFLQVESTDQECCLLKLFHSCITVILFFWFMCLLSLVPRLSDYTKIQQIMLFQILKCMEFSLFTITTEQGNERTVLLLFAYAQIAQGTQLYSSYNIHIF